LTRIRTQEGAQAVNEAISFIRSQKKVHPLIWNKGLHHAAKNHVDDIGPKGLVTFDSSDGTNARHRIEKHGKIGGCFATSLSFL
jgi:uncharacterized protein YkwD